MKSPNGIRSMILKYDFLFCLFAPRVLIEVLMKSLSQCTVLKFDWELSSPIYMFISMISFSRVLCWSFNILGLVVGTVNFFLDCKDPLYSDNDAKGMLTNLTGIPFLCTKALMSSKAAQIAGTFFSDLSYTNSVPFGVSSLLVKSHIPNAMTTIDNPEKLKLDKIRMPGWCQHLTLLWQ